MAPVTVQLGLLTLAGSAFAAAPHGSYRHSRYHHSSPSAGASRYTGAMAAPYSYSNGTAVYGPTGTGTAYSTGVSSSSIDAEETSAAAYPTTNGAYASPSAAYGAGAGSSAAGADNSLCAASGNTVYQTVYNTVTVTADSGYETFSAVGTSSSTADAVDTSSSSSSYEAPSTAAGNVVTSYVVPVAPSSESSSVYVAPTTEAAPAPAPSSESSSSVYVAPTSESSVYVAPTTEIAPAPASSAPSSSSSADAATTSSAPAYTGSAYSPSSTSSAPSSGSTTCSTNAKRASSDKRGCAYNDASFCSKLGGMSWGWNWGATKGDGMNLEYVPMLWGNKMDFVSQWPANAQAAIDAGSTVLMGFNEPDMPEEANLPCPEAATLWGSTMAQFKGKAKLVSPGVTSDLGNSSRSLSWLSDFADNVGGHDAWDVTQVHYYQDCSGSSSDYGSFFDGFFEEAHTKFGNKPVWVTEVGCNAWDPADPNAKPASDDQIRAFMTYAIDFFERTDYIERYSWAMADNVDVTRFPSALFTNGEANSFGDLYAQGGCA